MCRFPSNLFVDWLYEALAEQRREKTIGKGIFSIRSMRPRGWSSTISLFLTESGACPRNGPNRKRSVACSMWA